MNFWRRLVVPISGLTAMLGLAVIGASSANAFNFPGFSTMGSSNSAGTCGGTTLYKADGTKWQCSFDDEFNGTRIDTTKWSVPTTFLTGDVTSVYSCTPNDSRVESESGGALHLSMIQVATPVQCNSAYAPTSWIGGTVSTNGRFSQTYGRWEVRMRAPAGVTGGFNENFWMFPDPKYTVWNWPSTGEIDAGQQFSWFPNQAYPEAHYGDGTQAQGVTYQACDAQRGVWNVYDLIWTPTSLTFQINGTTCFVNTSADPAFTKPFFINLSEALWAANSTTQGSATMDVDYVRVWK